MGLASGQFCLVWGTRSSLTPSSALLAAPRMHYLADSGECVSVQPSVAVPCGCAVQSLSWRRCWDQGGRKGREEAALERLGQGRAELGQSWWQRWERMS